MCSTSPYPDGISGPYAIHVNAALNTAGGYCTVGETTGSGGGEIYCFNAAGIAADSQFSYSLFHGAAIPDALGGSALILAGNAPPYVDFAVESSSTPSIVTASYEATGTNVYFGRGVLHNGTVTSIGLVTAYGTNGNYCSGNGSGEEFGGAMEAAYCFTHNGTYVPSESQGASFFISLTTQYDFFMQD